MRARESINPILSTFGKMTRYYLEKNFFNTPNRLTYIYGKNSAVGTNLGT